MKKTGPCKIVRKFSSNAYEVKFPTRIGISPIFNVADLYLYWEPEEEQQGDSTTEENPTVNWEEEIPKTGKREVEAILEKRVSKKTKSQTYYQYLIKWKWQPMEDASWMTTTEL